MTDKTSLRQADAKAVTIGMISDKKLEIKTEDGVRRIEGTVTVKTNPTNFVQWKVNCAEKTKEGKNNKTFAGILTVLNEYKSIADYGEDEADMVRVTGQINPFRSKTTGEEIIGYAGKFFSRIKNGQEIEPKAEFEIEMFINSLIPETKEGEETGRYKINGWVPTYNGIEPVDLIVPEDLASTVESIYEPRQTAKFYGNIVQNVTYTVSERPMAFGVKKETKPNFINELVVTGGSPVYDAEEGELVPYDPATIRAAIEERKRMIEENQNRPNNQTNTKPSGASRGRSLGW